MSLAKTISTTRLDLVPVSLDLFDAIAAEDAVLAEALGAVVPERWSAFGRRPLLHAGAILRQHPHYYGWWTYLVVRRVQPYLIGLGGYKGPPDSDGQVEIGYEINESHRRQGYATEFARALVEQALGHPDVTRVIAHTIAPDNPSTRILARLGFNCQARQTSTSGFPIWRWQLDNISDEYTSDR